MVQPLNKHAQIATIGAQCILSDIAFQPQGVEKLFYACEILFHRCPFFSASVHYA
jgi:hypothetical protein